MFLLRLKMTEFVAPFTKVMVKVAIFLILCFCLKMVLQKSENCYIQPSPKRQDFTMVNV